MLDLMWLRRRSSSTKVCFSCANCNYKLRAWVDTKQYLESSQDFFIGVAQTTAVTHKRDKSPANAKLSWDYASFLLGFANSCQPSSSKMIRESSSIVKKLTTRQSKREEKNVAMSDLDSTKKENWKKVQADRALKRLLKHLTSSIRQLDYTFTFLRTVNPWLIVKCCMSKSFEHSTSVARGLELVFTPQSLICSQNCWLLLEQDAGLPNLAFLLRQELQVPAL